MGLPPEIGSSMIRISFGPDTSEADVERFTAEWRRMKDRASKAVA
jgi:cysteine desulfurase